MSAALLQKINRGKLALRQQRLWAGRSEREGRTSVKGRPGVARPAPLLARLDRLDINTGLLALLIRCCCLLLNAFLHALTPLQ